MRSCCAAGILIAICFFITSCSKSGTEYPGLLKVGQSATTNKKNDTSTSVNKDTAIFPPKNITYKVSTPVSLNGAHDIVLNALQIQNASGICIRLTNCYNITISNCKLGPSLKTGIELVNCTNITVDSCYISNVSTGLYVLQSSSIKFNYNEVKNVQGPYPQGQMLQFDNVTGSGNRILDNKCENISGASNPEDVISMYESNGTATDPILISGNWLRGGGPSRSGSGIILGDKGGSYIIASDNILVNTGNCGIGIAGGNNIEVINNEVYSAQTSVSNVGIYIWNQSDSGCAMNTISGNKVNWKNSAGEDNDSWNNGNCGTVTGWNTNIWGASLSSSILPVQF